MINALSIHTSFFSVVQLNIQGKLIWDGSQAKSWGKKSWSTLCKLKQSAQHLNEQTKGHQFKIMGTIQPL